MGSGSEGRIKTQPIIIGARGSKLSLWQAHFVKNELQRLYPSQPFSIETIKTHGDIDLNSPLFNMSKQGVFTKELEIGLLEQKIDLAVHSLKDMQTTLPKGLTIGAILKREDSRDALISKNNIGFELLQEGAHVATSSPRRRDALAYLRSDLQFENIRGNLNTRFKKFDKNHHFDAMVLAVAGIVRLGFSHRITSIFDIESLVPAVGQGALAIEVHEDSSDILSMVSLLSDEKTKLCAEAERSFLRTMQSGCQSPVGANARFNSKKNFVFNWFVGYLEEPHKQGTEIVENMTSDNEACHFGANIARRILQI